MCYVFYWLCKLKNSGKSPANIPIQTPSWCCEEVTPIQKRCTHTQMDRETVPGTAGWVIILLFMWRWQKRSRLGASIPDTFSLFLPSFLHILHPLPHNSPIPHRPLVTSCLCFGSKSLGCSSREQRCYGVRVKKKNGHCPGRIRQGLLCAAPEWSKVGERRKTWGGCEPWCQVSSTVNQQAVSYCKPLCHT